MAIIIASVASLLKDCSKVLIQAVPTEIEITSLRSELEKVFLKLGFKTQILLG